MLNHVLIKQRALRLLGGTRSFKDLADKQWTICPGHSSYPSPAIFLEGELDKVTAVQDETTFAYELRRVQGGTQHNHAPTMAYRLTDVYLVDGSVYKNAMRYSVSPAKPKFVVPGNTNYISSGVLACSFVGNKYFGHWMTDDVPMALAAQQLGQAVRTSGPLTVHQTQYSSLFGVQPVALRKAKFKELLILEDFGQNQYKRQRYDRMKTALTQATPARKGPDIMLLRGTSGVARILVNENEVAEFLSKQGFDILQPDEKMSAAEIVARMLGARIVVAVEGSQLAHAVFTMGENGVLLTLQPPYRFNNAFKDITDCLDLRYSFIVGKQVDKGFEIKLEHLARVLDRIRLSMGY